MERQNFFDRGTHRIIEAESDARLRLHLAALEFEPQFDEKQFLEDQADMRRGARGEQVLHAFAGVGPVYFPQRLPRPDQAEVAADRGRDGIGNFRREILQRRVQDAPKPARGQAALPGGFVDGDDSPDLERVGGFLLLSSARGPIFGVAQDFKLRLHQLQFAAI